MSEKININIVDFDLFLEVMTSVEKILESAKITISENGLGIYGAKDRIARCEFESNSVNSSQEFSFCIADIKQLNKILKTVKEVHDGDYSDLKIFFDGNRLNFSSKKFKTRFSTQIEDTISQWVAKKITTEFQYIYEFTTTSDMVKRVDSHAFICPDRKDVRVYLEFKEDMEKNSVFSSIGNRSSDFNNEIVLKFGLLNSGCINGTTIIDLDRLKLFNLIYSNDIKVAMTTNNCLIIKTSSKGKNGTYFNTLVLCTILKS